MVRKLARGIELTETALLFAMFLFLSFAIVADVICRKLFFFSFTWLEELSRYLFIFSSFTGASIAVTRDEHPKMTAVYTFIGPRKANVLELIANALCMVFFAGMTAVAWKQVSNLVIMGTVTSTLKVPLFTAYFIIPVSMIGMVVRFALRVAGNVRKMRSKAGEEGAEQ